MRRTCRLAEVATKMFEQLRGCKAGKSQLLDFQVFMPLPSLIAFQHNECDQQHCQQEQAGIEKQFTAQSNTHNHLKSYNFYYHMN